jgi:wyosine [tRNA(Phe)-imidazoG37] synthetase (radical SAM superfamily)
MFKKNIRTINDWITQLNEYKNVKNISLAGFASEPTLYPYIFELIKYLKSRNIKIELYTNGNTHDKTWWRELGKILTKNDRTYFTICGSTQELHSKYRVGSNL